MQLLPKLIGVSLALVPMLALALPSDDSKPMLINAGSTLINYKTGVSTYEGFVKMDQGTTHVLADRATVRRNSKHQLEEVILYGIKQLASYTTMSKEGDTTPTVAKAKVIKFYPQKSLAILEGDAFITQDQSSFQGPVIFYNIKDQIISSPASKKGRATLVIQPTQLASS